MLKLHVDSNTNKPMYWDSVKSPDTQVILVLEGELDRNKLPEGFSNNNNPLLALTQGGSGTFRFTAIVPYSKDKFNKQTLKGQNVTMKSLFGDVQLCATVHRTTFKTEYKNSPVCNPTTGEVVQFEGMPVYQYAEVQLGTENKAQWHKHNVPAFLNTQVNVL